MKNFSRLRRDDARPGNARSARPRLESLEGRALLATVTGGRWTYPNLITYCFMPDGTSIGGTPSSLFQSLNQVAPAATWQLQFQKAAAVWAAVANVNLALVSDSGAPVGGEGFQQGDPRYGDIRIGAIPQAGSILGYALAPPPINGGSDAGDIVLNSAIAWKINSDFDLQTVAIHEIGHALGMGHSSISSAVMYAYYTNMKQGLTSDDIAGIRSIYGPTASDTTSNSTAASAIDLTPMVNSQSQVSLGGQYIASASSFEWYKVTVPAGTSGSLTAVMQSSGLSSLSPRLAVFNANMAAVGQSIAPNSYGSTETFTVTGVSPGQVYYVRASAANTGPSAVGAFALQLNMGSTPLPPVAAPNTTVFAQPDQGINMMFDTTEPGTSDNSGKGSRSSGKGSNSGSGSVDDGDHTELIQIGDMTSWGDKLTIGEFPPAHSGSGGQADFPAGPPDSRWTGSSMLFAVLDQDAPVNLVFASHSSDQNSPDDSPASPPARPFLLSLDQVLSTWQRKHTFAGL